MHFIAVSAKASHRTQLAALSQKAAALIGIAADDNVPPDADASSWLAAAGLPHHDDGAIVVIGRQPTLLAANGLQPVALAAVAQRWHGLGAPQDWPTAADFMPPFALALRERARDCVRIVTDAIGLSHVYVAQVDGFAAASSSALALAQLFGLGIDAGALFGMAQTGAMIGTDTPFAGVRKLAAGTGATLAAGVLQLMPPPAPPVAIAAADATVAAGAALLRDIMTALATHFPEAEFELSGGLDSRLLLAALPASARAGRSAFTIGTAASADVAVARQIVARTGLAHSVADPDASLENFDLAAMLTTAACEYQFSGNPLDRVLIARLARRYCVPRFSGQNGEALRGFYYAGQRLDAVPTRAMAQWLVDWRLITNDAVDPALFTRAFNTEQRPALRERLTDLVLDCAGTSWAQKLDTLYERERMQHWCGIGVSGVQHERQILMPFFDARLTAFARAVPPDEKAGAKFAAALLKALDPALAALRLDSGLSPRALARGGLYGRFERAGTTASKTLRKIAQRLRRSAAPTVSASSAMTLFWQQVGPAGLDIAPLRRWGIFDDAALDRFASGAWRPDRPTLGFLINCCALAGALDADAPVFVDGIAVDSGTPARNAIDRQQSYPSTPLLAASE